MKHSITEHNVPRETFEAISKFYSEQKELFEAYIDQLQWWNGRINLISRDVSRETIAAHIRHSLLLTQFSAYQSAETVVDAGTGGGLPGLPLAIANPDKSFILNDIVTKKALALKQMARKQGLSNVETLDQSIAALTISHPFLLISKHAFKIDSLFNFTAHLPWETMVLYKGIRFTDELNEIDPSLDISIYNLYEKSAEDFYKDKAILVVSR